MPPWKFTCRVVVCALRNSLCSILLCLLLAGTVLCMADRSRYKLHRASLLDRRIRVRLCLHIPFKFTYLFLSGVALSSSR